MSISRKPLEIVFGFFAIFLVGLILWRFQRQLFDLLQVVTNRQELIDAFQNQSPLDLFLFTLLLILMIWLPGAPYSVLAIVAGICFGHWTGFFMNVVAATVGNFSAATILPKLTKQADRHTKRRLYQDLLKTKHPTLDILLGYAIPFVPSMVINLAATKLIDSKAKLATVCLVGSLPTAALYAFGGDATLRGNMLHIVVAVILALLLASLVLFVIRTDHKKTTTKP